ncbi:MAG: hypothetical protein J6L90_05470 [Clostridia bacterium]|nr:hypothetical protein [Clostridia bacterium]
MKASRLRLALLLITALALVAPILSSCDALSQDGEGDCIHVWEKQEVLKAATCGTDEIGTVRHTCSLCGATRETEVRASKAHDLRVITLRSAACGVEGLMREECRTCDYSREYTTSALVHSYGLRAIPDGGGCAVMCPKCLDIERYVSVIRYEDYGAAGDGRTDDSSAIRAAHEDANRFGLPVEGKEGAVYYIGSLYRTINIKTDTDWNGAELVFDDSVIKWNDKSLREVNVFTVVSDLSAVRSLTVPEGLAISRGQTNIGMSFDEPCMIKIESSYEKIYMRYGVNSNSGENKSEVILVDRDGNVDPSTPIQYDYGTVTSVTVFSIDDKPIRIGNGTITTVVPDPKADTPDYENNYCYYSRGISVKRSNSTLYNIKHDIVGEDMTVEIDRDGDGIIEKWGDDKSYGVPYRGFFSFNSCYGSTMEGCTVKGHQAYSFYQGSSRNEMGSYDITASFCIDLKFHKVVQYENEATGETITNRFMYHGVMGSNFCRNVVMDECYLDRFDAHQGLHNARITRSTLGFGILVTGGGKLYIEDVYRISEGAFIHLRSDYNSVFDGDVVIKSCRMGSGIRAIIDGTWRSFYNGLPNYMIRNLTVDGLTVEGSALDVYIFDISGADSSKNPPDDKTNKLYLPESVTVSNIKNLNGERVSAIATARVANAFSAVVITEK